MSKGQPRVDIEETHSGTPAGAPALGRRRLLIGAGLGGAALSLLPFMSGTALASSGGGTTTTAPPRRPTPADEELLNEAQAFELSIRDLYDVAITSIEWGADEATVMLTFRQSHEDYATGLNGALGRNAVNRRNERLFEELKGQFGKDRESALQAAWTVTSAAVATYMQMLGELQGTNLAGRVASVQVAEARHCTVLAQLLGTEDLALLLVDEEAEVIEVDA